MKKTAGMTSTTLLIIAAVVLAVVAIAFWAFFHQGPGDERAYHCEACGKDFNVDINKLGNTLPKCPSCSSDKTMPQKSK